MRAIHFGGDFEREPPIACESFHLELPGTLGSQFWFTGYISFPEAAHHFMEEHHSGHAPLLRWGDEHDVRRILSSNAYTGLKLRLGNPELAYAHS
jgi:hypothetical protein